MTISAKIIADSIHKGGGPRLTTFELQYPRFIHAEFMTHRVISRNASSSRAIPVKRMIEMIEEDPAMPIEFGRNQRGMQSAGEHDETIILDVPQAALDWKPMRCDMTAGQAWKEGLQRALEVARAFDKAGYHKQVVNRLLEPWAHIKVVASATDWENFFALRAHPDAQPEIQELAKQMLQAMGRSRPVERGFSRNHVHNWHLPYISDYERSEIDSRISTAAKSGRLQKMSAARCARVSYLNHDGTAANETADLRLYEKLAGGEPLHASPLEHQAFPSWGSLQGNFTGWAQFRKLHENECSSYDIPCAR